jgi:hypothetical protein
MLQRIKNAPWPYKLLAASQAAGLVIYVKLALSAKGLQILSFFGLCVAWGAALAALLVTVGAIVELARKRPSSILASKIAPVIMATCGAGFVVGTVPLLAAGSRGGTLTVAGTGVLLLGYGLWRRRSGYPNALYASLHLVLVVLAFSAPRETGFFSLTWANIEAKQSVSISGSASCNAIVGKKASLASRRPPFILRTQGLRGLWGRQVALSLGHSALPKNTTGLAIVRVSGRLDGASASCYLPGYHSEWVQGTLTIELRYLDDRKKSRLRCNASYTMAITQSATLAGVGSCRDMMRYAANRIAASIRAKVLEATGH